MSAQPLVSVIVPVYNAKNHIARCVESIRRQTYTNLQIILLNDGSRDVSLDVCRMFAQVDGRITLIDKANSGVSATRNLGMRAAKGEYLQFADADDTLQPYATELLVDRAQRYAADMVIAHYNRVEPPRERERLRPPRRPGEAEPGFDSRTRVQTFGFLLEGPLTKAQFAYGLMQEPASFYYGVMWNKLYRTAIVQAHPDIECSEELDYSEDFYFNLSYIRYAERFYALSTPVYNYVQNPQSLVHNLNPVKVLSTRWELSAYYKDLYKQLGLYEDNKIRLNKYFFGIAES